MGSLCLVCAVPCEEDMTHSLPAGLVLLDTFVSAEEAASLLAAVDWSSGNDDVTGEFLLMVFVPGLGVVAVTHSLHLHCLEKAMKHRRVKHYGFEFRYDNNNVDKDKPLSAGKASCFYHQT